MWTTGHSAPVFTSTEYGDLARKIRWPNAIWDSIAASAVPLAGRPHPFDGPAGSWPDQVKLRFDNVTEQQLPSIIGASICSGARMTSRFALLALLAATGAVAAPMGPIWSN